MLASQGAKQGGVAGKPYLPFEVNSFSVVLASAACGVMPISDDAALQVHTIATGLCHPHKGKTRFSKPLNVRNGAAETKVPLVVLQRLVRC